MARGNIYQIIQKSDTNDATLEHEGFPFSYYGFYDDIERLDADYVEDDNSGQAIDFLKELLTNCDFDISEEVPAGQAFSFTTDNETLTLESKCNYFKDAYINFIRKAQEILLPIFASNQAAADHIEETLTERYGDMVWAIDEYGNGMLMPRDTFIRQLTPDTTYFVTHKTIIIH